MLSFKNYILLSESRIDWLKSQGHDPEVVDHYASQDPTKKKLYTQYLVNQHNKGNITPDTEGLSDTINRFHENKDRLPKEHKDINKHDFNNLNDLLDKHVPVGIFNHPDTTTVHEDKDNGVSIKTLDSKKAALATRKQFDNSWCTSRDDNLNAFHLYQREDDPVERRLHLIEHRGKFYQYYPGHFDDDFELSDRNNIKTIFDELHPDLQKSILNSNKPQVYSIAVNSAPELEQKRELIDKGFNKVNPELITAHGTVKQINKLIDEQANTLESNAINNLYPRREIGSILKLIDQRDLSKDDLDEMTNFESTLVHNHLYDKFKEGEIDLSKEQLGRLKYYNLLSAANKEHIKNLIPDRKRRGRN